MAAGFREQVPADEAAAHHVHHGGDIDGGQGDVDDRAQPPPDRGGRSVGTGQQAVDQRGAEPAGHARPPPPAQRRSSWSICAPRM
ncbi:hypothetical protein [Actinacidiphila oryziradicis]|uniref:hypothetical protein n=1 Tax=Actinacidiphila oryziradicis TaxID=2571141 RepID=UPI0010ACF350|nr:hypothetical protein [Actinacidiphila oryziradicis]